MLEGVVPWPVEAAELYRKLGYWRGETIGECFARLRTTPRVSPWWTANGASRTASWVR
jgi:non-ribosomal peptide synthetase component E (peptide arylation enzyme)